MAQQRNMTQEEVEKYSEGTVQKEQRKRANAMRDEAYRAGVALAFIKLWLEDNGEVTLDDCNWIDVAHMTIVADELDEIVEKINRWLS